MYNGEKREIGGRFIMMYKYAKELESGDIVRIKGSDELVRVLSVEVEDKVVEIHGLSSRNFYIKLTHDEVTQNI